MSGFEITIRDLLAALGKTREQWGLTPESGWTNDEIAEAVATVHADGRVDVAPARHGGPTELGALSRLQAERVRRVVELSY